MCIRDRYYIVRNNSVIGIAEVIAVKVQVAALKIIKLKTNIAVGDKLINRGNLDNQKDENIFVNSQQHTNIKRRESWYTYWGLGYSLISYPPNIEMILNTIKNNYSPYNVTICLDMFGIYFHVKEKHIMGFVINGAGDRYQYSTGYYFQINQYGYNLSSIRYLGRHFGSGLFLRGDIGLASYVYQSNIDGNYRSELGFGALFGGGVSIDFGGTRLLLNVNYSYRRIESQESGILSFSLGGLF